MEPTDGIDEMLGFQLVRLCRAHRQGTEEALGRLGLHVGQELLLLQLWNEDGASQSCLAEAGRVDSSTITKALQRMERSGLLQRAADHEDARISRVSLTDRGRALRDPVLRVWQTMESRLVHGLTDAEVALLRRLLLQLVANLA